MDKLDKLSIRIEQQFKRSLLTNENFHEQVATILRENGISKNMFKLKTDLADSTCDRVMKAPKKREESRNFSMQTIISICVGLKLDLHTTGRLLSSQGLAFSPTNKIHNAYLSFVQNSDILDIEACNSVLERMGIGKTHYLGTH